MNKKISTPIAIGVILVLAILVGVFTINQFLAIDKEGISKTEINKEVKESVAGWKTYSNEEYGYEVKYPEEKYSKLNFYAGPELLLWSPSAQMNIKSDNLLGKYILKEETINNTLFKMNYFVSYGGQLQWERSISAITENNNNYYVITITENGLGGEIPDNLWKGADKGYALTDEGYQFVVHRMANKEEELLKTLTQILSTFKFID